MDLTSYLSFAVKTGLTISIEIAGFAYVLGAKLVDTGVLSGFDFESFWCCSKKPQKLHQSFSLPKNPLTIARYNELITNIYGIVKEEQKLPKLTPDTQLAVFNAQLLLAEEPYWNAVDLGRKERRVFKGVHFHRYYEEINSTLLQFNKIYYASLSQVLKDLDCSIDKIDLSCMKKNCFCHFKKLEKELRNNGRTKNELIKISSQKLKLIIKEQKIIYENLRLASPDPNLLPIYKWAWMEDVIKEKFGFEVEEVKKVALSKGDNSLMRFHEELEKLAEIESLRGFNK